MREGRFRKTCVYTNTWAIKETFLRGFEKIRFPSRGRTCVLPTACKQTRERKRLPHSAFTIYLGEPTFEKLLYRSRGELACLFLRMRHRK